MGVTVAEEKRNELDFGSITIIVGVSLIVLTVLCILVVNLFRDDNPNEITWVG